MPHEGDFIFDNFCMIVFPPAIRNGSVSLFQGGRSQSALWVLTCPFPTQSGLSKAWMDHSWERLEGEAESRPRACFSVSRQVSLPLFLCLQSCMSRSRWHRHGN